MPLFWELLNEENKQRIKGLMPKTWNPPKAPKKPIEIKGQIESVEEIDRIMREKPHYD